MPALGATPQVWVAWVAPLPLWCTKEAICNQQLGACASMCRKYLVNE